MWAFMRGAAEKEATASKTKGVVGQIGRKRPMAPNPKKRKPTEVSRIVLKCQSPSYSVLLVKPTVLYHNILYSQQENA